MPLPTSEEELQLIVSAGRQAATIALEHFRRDGLRVDYKENDSPVSEGDFAVDAFLRESLLAARPDYGWLSEETADDDPEIRLNAARTFIVDPIDGTRAYVSGRSCWGISIAIVEHGRPIAGVLNCPALDEEYAASIDDSATPANKQVNGDPVVGGRGALVHALREQMDDHSIVESRYVPSLAYRIIMVGDGRLQGTFIRANAHEWDLAAADIIAGKAGAAIVDGTQKPIRYNQRDPKQGALVCASPAFIGPMLNVVTASSIR